MVRRAGLPGVSWCWRGVSNPVVRPVAGPIESRRVINDPLRERRQEQRGGSREAPLCSTRRAATSRSREGLSVRRPNGPTDLRVRPFARPVSAGERAPSPQSRAAASGEHDRKIARAVLASSEACKHAAGGPPHAGKLAKSRPDAPAYLLNKRSAARAGRTPKPPGLLKTIPPRSCRIGLRPCGQSILNGRSTVPDKRRWR